MIPWLDFWLFGNGRGLGAPFFDGRFYWLVDTLLKGRHARNGQLYTWSGGFGAQLTSFQWRHPVTGTRRRLSGNEYQVFSSSRSGPRVRVSWALVGLPHSIDEANARLREVERSLAQT